MKPMIIAKRIWDRAVAVQNKIGAAATYGAAPLYSYPGILTMWTAPAGRRDATTVPRKTNIPPPGVRTGAGRTTGTNGRCLQGSGI